VVEQNNNQPARRAGNHSGISPDFRWVFYSLCNQIVESGSENNIRFCNGRRITLATPLISFRFTVQYRSGYLHLIATLEEFVFIPRRFA
jgi:hypothetical protein